MTGDFPAIFGADGTLYGQRVASEFDAKNSVLSPFSLSQMAI